MAQKRWDELSPKEKKTGVIGLVIVGLVAVGIVASLANYQNVNFGNVSNQTNNINAQEDYIAPVSEANTTPDPTRAAPTETVSQKNAVRKAKSYINMGGFSHDGLIAQLEYEQYSNADATYGADNVGADWNEQAAKKAKSYMSYSAFSRGGLIDQLIYEKFTPEQAAYGADSVGI